MGGLFRLAKSLPLISLLVFVDKWVVLTEDDQVGAGV